MPTVVVIQHHELEGLGRLGGLLAEAGIETDVIGSFDPVPVNALDDASGLIVLGGPMGVYETDHYPRLRDELDTLERALRTRLPVLGICLGSQLLAAALGAKVYPGPAREIGWHDVTLEEAAKDDRLFQHLPPKFSALHFHGDIFELPNDATALAHSAQTQYQAFTYAERAWGLLFHLEADVPQVRAMADEFEEDLHGNGLTKQSLIEASQREDVAVAKLARALFGEWCKLVLE
jgi:GMP synthase (glutamine-hydrolysing)